MPSPRPPFRALGLDHVVLRVRDVQRMLHFYERVIGCSRERDQPELGLYQLRAGRSLIDLVSVDAAPAPSGHNVDHFCITVSPFDEVAIRRHLAEYGSDAGAAASRYGAEGEGPSIYLRDPEGNGLELKAAASDAQAR